jgi:hypothetical protein
MDEFFGSQVPYIGLAFFMCADTFTQSMVSTDGFGEGPPLGIAFFYFSGAASTFRGFGFCDESYILDFVY